MKKDAEARDDPDRRETCFKFLYYRNSYSTEYLSDPSTHIFLYSTRRLRKQLPSKNVGMSELLIPFMLLALLLISLYFTELTEKRAGSPLPRISQVPRIRNINAARRILCESTLESRAKPNQRLVNVFGINNAFTTTDPIYHREFVTQAKGLIRPPNQGWETLTRSGKEIVGSRIEDIKLGSDSVNSGTLHLVRFVQNLVFRIVILKFFPESKTPSLEDVEFITTSINHLWMESKDNSPECGLLPHALQEDTTTQRNLLLKLD
ncbi:hypothetical protein VTL71DRAFT_10392 [Oculimacula yallundae]|uniref:Uncharacterized protein n=1 Tax=Oculimacula yallundae TaxID=86028 RepID=A0ABR4CSV5_9HELO